MRRFLKFAIVAGAIGALVGASISIAASSDGSGTRSGTRSQEQGKRLHRPPFARAAVLKAAAQELDVSTTQLRQALRTARQQVGPPDKPQSMDRDALRQAMQQHCTELTDAVGKALNKSGDDVRAAFKSALKAQVDTARSSGRISQAQADRIRSKIDSDSCVLPLRGPGCGPGGPGRMGGPPPPPDGSQNQQQSAPGPAFEAVPA